MRPVRVAATPSHRRKDNPDEHYLSDNICPIFAEYGVETVLIDFPYPKNQPLPQFDALLLPGGPDAHPSHFGQELDPHCGLIIPERDEIELRLAHEALRLGLPIFGICRGEQLINIAMGGDLYQDLPSNLGLHHRQDDDTCYFHDVIFKRPSLLGSLVPSDRYPTNSYHHQSVRNLAPGLRVTAHSPDGVIEAFEGTGEQFILGVQWHPETSYRHDVFSRRIFESFLAAAEKQRK